MEELGRYINNEQTTENDSITGISLFRCNTKTNYKIKKEKKTKNKNTNSICCKMYFIKNAGVIGQKKKAFVLNNYLFEKITILTCAHFLCACLRRVEMTKICWVYAETLTRETNF